MDDCPRLSLRAGPYPPLCSVVPALFTSPGPCFEVAAMLLTHLHTSPSPLHMRCPPNIQQLRMWLYFSSESTSKPPGHFHDPDRVSCGAVHAICCSPDSLFASTTPNPPPPRLFLISAARGQPRIIDPSSAQMSYRFDCRGPSIALLPLSPRARALQVACEVAVFHRPLGRPYLRNGRRGCRARLSLCSDQSLSLREMNVRCMRCYAQCTWYLVLFHEYTTFSFTRCGAVNTTLPHAKGELVGGQQNHPTLNRLQTRPSLPIRMIMQRMRRWTPN